MRSRPPKQIEQEVESSNDVVVEVKDEVPSISTGKQNTFIIIVASIVLVGICYFIFFSGVEDEKQVIEPVIVQPADQLIKGFAEPIAPSENGKSIFDLEEVDKKEKSENIDLLEKQAKPEIPDIPELPSDVASTDLINLDKLKEDQNKSDVGDLTNDNLIENASSAVNQEELKLRDQKILELETKIKEFSENSAKEKQTYLDELKKRDEDQKKALERDELLKKQKEEEQDSIFEPRYSPIVVFSDRRDPSPPNGVGQDKNIVILKGDEVSKIKESGSKVDVSIIKDRTRTIAQGKMLTAILETSINTEFPGAVRGIIARDVYGESGREVLIPKGSRLYGSYSSEVRRGQGRVNISWTRLLRPDGISLDITLTAADQFGRAGIPGEVDNRYSSLVANSLLTSVLAVAGTAAAQSLMSSGSSSQTSTTVNANLGTTTTYGNAGNQALYDVTKTIIDIVGTIMKNSLDLNPVIRIPQGTRMTVIVNSDIVVPKMR
ncbi:MAG: TrbI/VirB10 family protein [Alphaproteobacteria bacterium]|nr:TrbI/VirB10 family protein [Alphaproteobacteria bacterium]